MVTLGPFPTTTFVGKGPMGLAEMDSDEVANIFMESLPEGLQGLFFLTCLFDQIYSLILHHPESSWIMGWTHPSFMTSSKPIVSIDVSGEPGIAPATRVSLYPPMDSADLPSVPWAVLVVDEKVSISITST